MTRVTKPKGGIKVCEKLSGKWTSQCLGAFHAGPKNTLKLMVCGMMYYLPWCRSVGVYGRKHEQY